MAKPGIPQGTRDFTAEVIQKRSHILNIIRETFKLYGFEPLETPAMENLDTLMGKYGEEGDKLIFKILNNGLNDPKNKGKAETGFQKILEGKNTADLTERALKYDLTIPFARFVAMNHNLLTFPYKRYQIQPVWRADRPQRGRYREFTQCDADIVGSNSLINEVELANLYHDVFTKLGLKSYTLKINNRKLLTALAVKCGVPDQLITITTAIDKLDKIGAEKVNEELLGKGLLPQHITYIETYLAISGTNANKLQLLEEFFTGISIATEGISEVRFLADQARDVNLEIDLSLARGLNYYTGMIYEVKAPEHVKMGSIGGGGRYDDLTGLFGVPGIPGVGISFGVDRIYDVLEEMKLFPDGLNSAVQVLFLNMGADDAVFAMQEMRKLRSAGIACELFHENQKLDKQFRYADKKKIPFAVIIGSRERENNQALVKNLMNGTQEAIGIEELPVFFGTK